MATQENNGGTLHNEQVEQDLKVKGHQPDNSHPYRGAQDTGDQTVRHRGSEVQQRDGQPEEGQNGA